MESSADPGTIVFQIGLLVLLTIINAFFAGAEMAIVSVNKNKIRLLADNGNKKAILIEKLFNNSTGFLSTIQVVITFASFFSGAAAATGISIVLGEWMGKYNIPYNQTISVVIVTLINAYFNLVFGELVPKRIALQKAEWFSLFAVKPIYGISKVLAPFIKLLSVSTNGVLKLLGMKSENLEQIVTEEEIKSMLQTGTEKGVFNDIEKNMINSIFSFDDKMAKDVMIPRKDVLAVDLEEPLKEQFEDVLESRHSLIPVYSGAIDNIVGILHIKDFFISWRNNDIEDIDISSVLKEPYYVPEGKATDELFLELQKTKNRMAILIDEYGGFSGIVTIEDLVEEIVGEIVDEYEQVEIMVEELGNNEFMINGAMLIEDFNTRFHTDISSENYDTLSGYMIERLGYVPSEQDQSQLQEDEVDFKIHEVKDKRINKMYVKINSKITV